MVVPDLIFDAVLFGALLVAVLLDSTVPSLHGTAFLVVVGAATYIAAQELCDALNRRSWWTQESLATALSLSTGGFIYVWWRNDSDLAWLALSIGLMMASLMVAISVIAAFGTTVREGSPRPLLGSWLTVVGSLVLGIPAGLLTLEAPVAIKVIVVGAGVVLWKLRESVRPPGQNALSQEALTVGLPTRPVTTPAGEGTARTTAASPASGVEAAPRTLIAHPSGRWMLIPQRGTLLDRFVPMLVLGAVLFLATRQLGPGFFGPISPAASASSTAPPPPPTLPAVK